MGEAELSERQELEKTVYEVNYLRNQATELQNQVNSLQMLLDENASATKAVENLGGIKDETFFSLGAGVFAKVKVSDGQKVLCEVGARTVVEKTVEDAKALLQDRRSNLEKAAENLRSSAENVEKKLNELSFHAMALSQKLRTQEAREERGGKA